MELIPLQSEPLRFPRGVRFAKRDELPPDTPKRWLDKLKEPPPAVTTGYKLSPKPDQLYLEANVHADRIFEVVSALAVVTLPNVAAPIVGIRGEDPVPGPYTWRDDALRVLAPHAEALQHDGFLEFGLIFQHKGKTDVIFVRSSKYLQIWTTNLPAVKRVLEDSGIPEVDNLAFIDEYPTVYERLRQPDENAGWPFALKALETAFAELESVPTPGVRLRSRPARGFL